LELPRLTHPNSDYTPVDIYCGLRDQALRFGAGGAMAAVDGVIAVLMETGYRGAVATLMTTADGSTSLYFSSGGGVLGAGGHAPVRTSSSAFLQASAKMIDLLQPTSEFPLPRQGFVRFYIVSTTNVRTAEGLEQDLGYNRHPLSPLFHLAHAVITAVRQMSPPPPPP